MTDVTMSRARYDALVNAVEAEDLDEAARILDLVAEYNELTTYILWVRWQNVGGEPPPMQISTAAYPPLQRLRLKLERPITREDVETFVQENVQGAPADIHVTPDRAGNIGWSTLDSYFS